MNTIGSCTFVYLVLHHGALADDKPSAYDMQRAVLVEQDVKKIEGYLKARFNPALPIGCGTFDSLDGAVNKENFEIVSLLLRYGARPKESTFVRAAFCSSHDAALKMVKAFLDSGANPNSKERYSLDQEMYWTALHHAAWRENSELVKLLLSQKNISVNDLDGDGYTPLMIAIQKGNVELVQLLLDAGGDTTIKDSKTGKTALSVSESVIKKQEQIKKLLAK